MRKTFEPELKEALREQGIDLRDRALTIEAARDALYQRERLQFVQKVHDERLSNFVQDEKLKSDY